MKFILIFVFLATCFVNYAQTQSCSNGYTAVGDSCLKLYDLPQNHGSAQFTCQYDHAHLTYIKSSDINTNFFNFVSQSGHAQVWIGLTCSSTSTSSCFWDDGSNTNGYNNFAPGNPTEQLCMAFETSSGLWTSHDCGDNLSFVCQANPSGTTLPPPTTPTPGSTNVDRDCGGNLENLWLDVVVVVDNSKGMTDEGITEVAANIATVFGNGTKIGNQYSDPRSTRLGIVTYNGQATIVADLNLLQSIDDLYNTVFSTLSSVSNSDDSFLAKGIGAAENVLQSGRANGVRSNYKRLVVVYASAYRGEGELDPIPVSDRLKSSGVIVATVAFDQDGDEALLAGLTNIASPNYAYTSKDLNLVGELQGAALQTNCFCPNLWTQYQSNFDDKNSYKYGVCIRAATISSSWTAAKFACQNLAKNGFLATEYDGQKHNFLFRIAQNNTAFQAPYIYHIGLSFLNGGWSWQQPAGHSLVPNTGYAPWNPSYPKTQSSNIGVVEQQFSSDLTVGWQNINAYSVAQYYMCEVASCDTDNYCP